MSGAGRRRRTLAIGEGEVDGRVIEADTDRVQHVVDAHEVVHAQPDGAGRVARLRAVSRCGEVWAIAAGRERGVGVRVRASLGVVSAGCDERGCDERWM
eukprot:6623636-Prymnesium_polylepis.1